MIAEDDAEAEAAEALVNMHMRLFPTTSPPLLTHARGSCVRQ